VHPNTLLAANAAVFAMMNGADLKKAAYNQAKKVGVATTAALAANGNGQKKRRKGDNLKPIITTENASSSLHESPTQAEPE
jgi:serine/threonine-protein kinase SRPK3